MFQGSQSQVSDPQPNEHNSPTAVSGISECSHLCPPISRKTKYKNIYNNYLIYIYTVTQKFVSCLSPGTWVEHLAPGSGSASQLVCEPLLVTTAARARKEGALLAFGDSSPRYPRRSSGATGNSKNALNDSSQTSSLLCME